MQNESEPLKDEHDIYPMVRRSKELLSLIGADARVLFFVHVPKTGGTDLAIKLQDSQMYNVFSLDAPEADYRDQVDAFLPKKPIFIRGHMYLIDAWYNLLEKMPYAEIFTILRNPFALHVSNATMIYERSSMHSPADQQSTSGTNQPEPLEKKLIEIIETSSYYNDYSDIYMKYFGYALENYPLMDRLKVAKLCDVDELKNYLLPKGNHQNQKRLNQSSHRLDMHASSLLNSDLLMSLGGLISKAERGLYKQLQSKADPAWIYDIGITCS